MAKKILFDMDGTIADLYNTKDWLTLLLNETEGLFRNLPVMHDQSRLKDTVENLIRQGFEIEVVTWTPKNVSRQYINTVEQEKKDWIQEHFPMIEKVHCLDYGTPKQKAGFKKVKQLILVDDNKEVNALWDTPKQRKSILADENLIESLQALLI